MTDWMPQHLLYSHESLLWLLVLVPVVALLPLLRNRRRRPSRLSIVLRIVVLALLVFSIAGPLAAYDGNSVTTIFAIDRSNSIDPSANDAANSWVADAIGKARADDAASIVTFGRQPSLAVPPESAGLVGNAWQQPGVDAVTNGDASDLSSALALARSLPVGESRRIVLLSDGAENQGDALSQADQAASEGISIDVVPLAGVDAADLRLASVSGPTALWQGDSLSVLATISVGAGGPVSIQLVIDGTVAATQNVTLQPGTTSYTLTHGALAPGFHAIDVRVSGSAEIDRIAENDDGALGLVVRDRPSVLMIAPDGSDPSKLTSALQSQGAEVKVVTPDDAPTTESGFAGYQAIVLNNVPAWTLSADQQTALVASTKDGGGLIAIGGSAAFGPGSYAGTTLEQALPVTVKVTDGRQRPKVAVMIVVDKSGSMAYDPSEANTSKLDLAKQGILTAASALTTGDQIGVIAFNDEPTWALPMTTLTGSGDQ
ncbi:MAG TPA: VWA domain-containing protein, partial [Thermomicrobiales bacterium]|nr:VWA domain-containing protein [Thermomicrobiales bacterium]